MHDRSEMPANERPEIACGREGPACAKVREVLHHLAAFCSQRTNNRARGAPMKRMIAMISLIIAFGIFAETSSAQTLKKVKDRGSLVCGVSQGLPGFSTPDDKGNW